MTTNTDITKLNTNTWSHKHGTIGEIVTGSADIKQCIANIIGTSKCSMPLMPEFGTDIIEAIGEKGPDAVDIAIAIFSKEIPKQEPRVEITSITGEYTENGEIHIIIYYTEIQTGVSYNIEVYL